jgi:hypothetical protein
MGIMCGLNAILGPSLLIENEHLAAYGTMIDPVLRLSGGSSLLIVETSTTRRCGHVRSFQ